MTADNRLGKNYARKEVHDAMEQNGYICDGCGREIRTRRGWKQKDPKAVALEGHHVHPIGKGGGRRSEMKILCGPNRCHSVADKLAFQHDILLPRVEERLGQYPFAQYLPSIEEGRVNDVVAAVVYRVRKAG